MNNIDFSVASVNPKITILKKPTTLTVALVFPAFAEEGAFSSDLAQKPYDGSGKLLSEITAAVAVMAAKDAALASAAPTVSYVTAKQKAFAAKWWEFLENLPGAPQPNDKALRKALELDVKKAFDSFFHKWHTGEDLPESKDGYLRNAMKVLREATSHGDAAIFLYRLRFWWPKAQIVLGGKKWVANSHKDWAEQLGMEERSFRTAYNHLLKIGMLEARVAKFKGITMNHVRPTEVTQALYASLKSADAIDG